MGKTILSLLFLSAFLFLRVANSHTFFHFSDDSADIDCELCEIITVTQQLTPFIDQAVDDTNHNNLLFCEKKTINLGYEEPRGFIVTPLTICNKPPPFS